MGAGEIFHFGEFTLEVAERRLTRGGKVMHLSPKAHDILVLLVRQAMRASCPKVPENLAVDQFVDAHVFRGGGRCFFVTANPSSSNSRTTFPTASTLNG